MFNNPFLKRYQPAVTVVALAAVVALLFSFAPVRAAAGNFLQIFRVQEVRIIPVDMNQVQNLENNVQFQGLLEQLNPEASLISGGGEPQVVASLAEAAALADFSPAEITALPPTLGSPGKVQVEPQSTFRLNLDKDLLEAIFAAAEIEISLPDSINETPIIATQPTAVTQIWGAENYPSLHFTQLRSPEVEYPDDLDLNALGVAGLQLLGMSKAEATAVGATIDWANTLVLPIPADMGSSITEVFINGAKGYTITNPDSPHAHAAAMWQKGGVTYLLEGQFSAGQILEMAQSVK